MTTNYPDPENPSNFDRQRFKDALAMVESSGGKYLSNKNSSAVGRYQFMYRYIKDAPMMKGVSKLEFMNSPEMQEIMMDKALDGTLQGFPNYITYAQDLKSKYSSNLRVDELAVLTHFLGMGDVKKYLKDTNGFKVPGVNATVDQYLERFNKYYGPVKEVQEGIQVPVNKQTKDEIPNINVPKQQPAPSEPVPQQPLPVFDNPRKFIETEYKAAEGSENDVIDLLQNPKAYGGKVEEGSVKDLVRFEEGGTHEQNPNGGLPIGMDNQGQMNTVEEGETKFKFKDGDYVFSDRIGLYPTTN